MIALVEFDPLVAGSIRSAVSGDVHQFADLRELQSSLDVDRGLDTVLLGPSVDQQAACELASRFRSRRPELGVILIRSRLDTTTVTEAIRAGLRDVLADRDMTQLGAAVERSARITREMLGAGEDRGAEQPRRGKIITVFSSKGGCGKTTVSTNLATFLAMGGHGSVALVDLDLAFGDVCIAMQIQPRHSISDAVTMGDRIDASGLLAMLEHHRSGVHVLAAPPTPELAEKVQESVVTEVLDVLAARYDYVVVDTPPAMDSTTLAAFDASDLIALLTTLDIPSLKNTKLSLETLLVLGFREDRLRLVLNRSDSQVGLNPTDVGEALGLDVVAQLSSSRDVPASTNRGEVLVAADPKHPFSIAIAAFAQSNVLPVNEIPAPTKAKRRSLFRRKL